MQLVLGVVLTLVSLTRVLGNETKGVTIEKSFLQSVHDCAEYLRVPKQRLVQYLAYEFPPDEETKCLIYCVGMDLRWWNNTCGLQVPAIVNFFQPVLGDRQYEKRTRECLERNVHTGKTLNNCCKAYETFQCYFQEFGNLVTCPQYVPATKLQATQAALDCLNMLRVPVELLKCYGRGDLPDVPETRCLYHCIDHRTGLYTSESGVHLSRFYVRDMSVNDLCYLSKETKACRDRIRQSGCDPCSEVYNTHLHCLTGIGVEGYTSGLITEAARIALTNLGVCCKPKLLPEPVVKPEVGYSYASYQPALSNRCVACGTVSPRLAFPPVTALPTHPPPLMYGHRKACSACGSVPNVVPVEERNYSGFKPAPYVKHVEHPASGRPQLMYFPAPLPPPPPPPLPLPLPLPPPPLPPVVVATPVVAAQPCSCTATPAVSKPAFSAFASRPHGPYPSCRSCRAEHFGAGMV
uniref:Odorant binding protein n=1 Tax=Anopheles dirus TaxID=7168 RepID=A0A9I3EGY2_9DIPT